MEKTDTFFLLRKMPQVLRARGYRLYLQNGQRLIDLWLNGGAAVLGHTPTNILRELKNTASRGLYAPYPHFTEGRFLKALSKPLPNYVFRFYAAPPQELALLFEKGNIEYWRPFTDPNNPFKIANKNNCYLLIANCTLSWREQNGLLLPLGLCAVACNDAASSQEQLNALPTNDILSPVLLATATRGIHDLIAASPQRGKPQLPRTFKVFKTDSCPWRREGIYLSLKETPTMETWEALFIKFLEAGFLLPPTPTHPLILPGEMSDGEDAKLAKQLSGQF